MNHLLIGGEMLQPAFHVTAQLGSYGDWVARTLASSAWSRERRHSAWLGSLDRSPGLVSADVVYLPRATCQKSVEPSKEPRLAEDDCPSWNAGSAGMPRSGAKQSRRWAQWHFMLWLGLLEELMAGHASHGAQRFVVLGAGRTGSNLLVHTLRQHPEVVVHGECFGASPGHRQTEFLDPSVRSLFSSPQAGQGHQNLQRLRQKHPQAFLQEIWSTTGSSAQAVGFKVFNDQLQWHYVRQLLLGDGSVKKLVLLREDVAAVIASREAATLSGNWAGRKVSKTFTVKDGRAKTWGMEYLRWYSFLSRELSDSRQPHLVVTYEQLEADLAGVMSNVTAFLGVTSEFAFRPTLEKQMVRPLEEIVLNYHHMLDVLQGAGIPRRLSFPVEQPHA